MFLLLVYVEIFQHKSRSLTSANHRTFKIFNSNKSLRKFIEILTITITITIKLFLNNIQNLSKINLSVFSKNSRMLSIGKEGTVGNLFTDLFLFGLLLYLL